MYVNLQKSRTKFQSENACFLVVFIHKAFKNIYDAGSQNGNKREM